MKHLGIRARVTAAFALGALLLSVVLSVITYELVRTQALRSEQSADERQAFVTANLVRSGLRTSNPDIPVLLSGLGIPSGSIPILYVDGQWYSSSLTAGRSSLFPALRDSVLAGNTVTQRFTSPSRTGAEYAVGVPLVDDKGAYFELFSLSDLAHTLDLLFFSLAAAAALTTLGGVGVGRWVSRRLLSPLRETARAAAAIAGGQLNTRLVAGDIDLADLASSFNAMVEALQDRIRRDARFASDVSHELRSPLTTIQTALQVMKHRRDELPERSAQALDLLSAEVERFDRLVQDLLEISSTDAGRALLFEEVDPRELVTQSISSTSASHLAVESDPGLGRAMVRADKRRMERVVANLVENAEMHAGGATRVALENGGSTVRIVIEDAGPGVQEAERHVIFDRFARGSAGRRRAAGRGTGLGLSLVEDHVRLHGGRVWVENRGGGGSRFVVELPIVLSDGDLPG